MFLEFENQKKAQATTKETSILGKKEKSELKKHAEY